MFQFVVMGPIYLVRNKPGSQNYMCTHLKRINPFYECGHALVTFVTYHCSFSLKWVSDSC